MVIEPHPVDDAASAAIATVSVAAEEESAFGLTRTADSDVLPEASEDLADGPIVRHDEEGRQSHEGGERDAAEPAVPMPERAEQADLAIAEMPSSQNTAVADVTDVPPRTRRVLRGSIDEATWTTISGWVWDPETPEERIRLELLEDETQLATAVASLSRPDLASAAIGDGQYAFSISLKPGLLSEKRHILHLRCAETGAAMPNSPIVLDPPAEARGAAFHYHVDEITDNVVAGWIKLRSEQSRHCVVMLKEGPRILARSVASRFRPDLLAAGIGDGCYAFGIPMPRSLLDGKEHHLEIVEEDTGFALTEKPIRWRSAAGTASAAVIGASHDVKSFGADVTARQPGADISQAPPTSRTDQDATRPPVATSKRSAASSIAGLRASDYKGTRVLVDISDLVYYIGEHANLTGIQRVQSSIVLAMMDAKLLEPSAAIFLSFNAKARNWVAIPTGFLVSLLKDLLLPEEHRLVEFPAEEARYGVLPGSEPFDGIGVLDDGNPSVLCLLGAAWVHQDYLHRVLSLKRRFGTRFVMTVHDLIPIYARETCDQDTARVFEEFMQRALPHVDHILAVSENTAKDVRRYLGTLNIAEPPITVTRNGSSFAEFLPKGGLGGRVTLRDLPERFVLFVATIEGRKNHRLMLDVWRRMVADGDDPPALVCVGRLGWKATTFISSLVETNYLDGRVHLLRDISDSDLRLLYDRCLFTVCPSFYEGWGLPVGESLAMGKICVASHRASLPEVAGECGVYIDIDSVDRTLAVIRNLIRDDRARLALEAKVRREYQPITWRSVAERVVAACEASIGIKWQEPYPYTALPYSTEISFGRLDHDADGTGELVLARIVDARLGYFKRQPLEERSFRLGEEIRSGGSWAQPERWGTWLCHAGGDIVFSLAADPSQFYYVFLRLRVCGWLHEQPVKLLANGEVLWEGEIGPEPRDITLHVRKRAGAASAWRLRIEAEVNLSAEVASAIAMADGRVPTIGFERLLVVPESDLKTRIDILYTRLLEPAMARG